MTRSGDTDPPVAAMAIGWMATDAIVPIRNMKCRTRRAGTAIVSAAQNRAKNVSARITPMCRRSVPGSITRPKLTAAGTTQAAADARTASIGRAQRLPGDGEDLHLHRDIGVGKRF